MKQETKEKHILRRILDREGRVIDEINSDAVGYARCKWTSKDLPLLLRQVFWYGKIAQQKGRKLFSEELTERVESAKDKALTLLSNAYLDSIKPIPFEQAVEFISDPLKYIEFAGFKRYLPPTPERRRDSDFQNERGFVRMPPNTNIYGRNAEQQGLEFKMLGPISCSIKGELLILDPDNVQKTTLYFDFKNWQRIFGCAMKKEEEFHYDFTEKNATLANFKEIMKKIKPELTYQS